MRLKCILYDGLIRCLTNLPSISRTKGKFQVPTLKFIFTTLTGPMTTEAHASEAKSLYHRSSAVLLCVLIFASP